MELIIIALIAVEVVIVSVFFFVINIIVDADNFYAPLGPYQGWSRAVAYALCDGD